MNSNESTHSAIDPTALMQERAQTARDNIIKVPEVVDTLIETLGELYKDLYDSDFLHPEGEPLSSDDATLLTVVAQEETYEELPAPRRFFGLRRTVRRLVNAEETKEVACWQASTLYMIGRHPVVTIYIGVADGAIYTQQTNQRKARPLDRTVLERATYPEAVEMLERAQNRRNRIASHREHLAWMAQSEAARVQAEAERQQWERERTEFVEQQATALDQLRERIGQPTEDTSGDDTTGQDVRVCQD